MRREFSAKTKQQALERAKFCCEGEGCGVSLVGKRVEVDHIDPSYFSGDNDLSNAQILCVVCHRIKTRRDITAIAKTKRIQAKHAGIRKRSGFKAWRKFNGELVWK
jgi:5-methylcytosine-specific restriction endonuclease McrA